MAALTFPCPSCGGTMRDTEVDPDGCDVIECVECLARIRVRVVPRVVRKPEPNGDGK